jgi:hypothetical protein
MRQRLAVTALTLVAFAAPAAAQNVAGSYEVKFDEVSTTCDPVRFTYTRGTVRLDASKTSLRVIVDPTPPISQLSGGAPKSGKINAKTPKKVSTSVQGIDGRYSVSGRVDDAGVLELVLVAEYTRQDNGKPLCTQSWNVRGIRQSSSDSRKRASEPVSARSGSAGPRSTAEGSAEVSARSGSAGPRSTAEGSASLLPSALRSDSAFL